MGYPENALLSFRYKKRTGAAYPPPQRSKREGKTCRNAPKTNLHGTLGSKFLFVGGKEKKKDTAVAEKKTGKGSWGKG